MFTSNNAPISHLMSGWWWTVDFILTVAAQRTPPLNSHLIYQTQYQAPKKSQQSKNEIHLKLASFFPTSIRGGRVF
jgi:hypothetical protein